MSGHTATCRRTYSSIRSGFTCSWKQTRSISASPLRRRPARGRGRSRDLVARGREEAVPLLAREPEVGAGGRLAHTLRLGRAQHDLDVRGMAGDPGDGDAGRRDAVFLGERLELVVELRVALPIADEDAVEEALLERRPGLESYAVQPRVVEDAVVAVDRLVE